MIKTNQLIIATLLLGVTVSCQLQNDKKQKYVNTSIIKNNTKREIYMMYKV